jgi:hypothetical protein
MEVCCPCVSPFLEGAVALGLPGTQGLPPRHAPSLPRALGLPGTQGLPPRHTPSSLQRRTAADAGQRAPKRPLCRAPCLCSMSRRRWRPGARATGCGSGRGSLPGWRTAAVLAGGGGWVAWRRTRAAEGRVPLFSVNMDPVCNSGGQFSGQCVSQGRCSCHRLHRDMGRARFARHFVLCPPQRSIAVRLATAGAPRPFQLGLAALRSRSQLVSVTCLL